MEVKIWSLCSVSSSLSHATLEQPFRTLAINWEVNIIVKKSSCVFPLASLSLCRCELFYIYMCMYVDVNLHMWLYNESKKERIDYVISITLYLRMFSILKSRAIVIQLLLDNRLIVSIIDTWFNWKIFSETILKRCM